MKKFSQGGGLNGDAMLEIMMEQKKPEKDSITLSGNALDGRGAPQAYGLAAGALWGALRPALLPGQAAAEKANGKSGFVIF